MRLTPRETDIVNMVLKDYSCAEMAEELHLSVRTIERHIFNVSVRIPVEYPRGMRGIRRYFKEQA